MFLGVTEMKRNSLNVSFYCKVLISDLTFLIEIIWFLVIASKMLIESVKTYFVSGISSLDPDA